MAPKLPGKFDDISKTAASVLGDDFQCKDFKLTTKQKTNLEGASTEINVDLFGKGDVKTPAKLTLKFPKVPFLPLSGFAIDKIELDQGGKTKVETSCTKDLHGIDGLKLQVNGDLANQTVAATYTGIKDTQVKVETKAQNPSDFMVDCLHGIGGAVIGAKLTGKDAFCPSVGVNYQQGDLFCSLIAKEKFSAFTLHSFYQISKDMKVAKTYDTKSGAWSVGGSAVVSDITTKVKLDSKMLVSCAMKKDLAKGTVFNGGASYNLNSGDITWGAKVSIE